MRFRGPMRDRDDRHALPLRAQTDASAAPEGRLNVVQSALRCRDVAPGEGRE
jgi:hypothetical protein